MTRYIMLDHGGVLDGEMTQTTPHDRDLVLSDLGDGVLNVLRNGVGLVTLLTELVNDYDVKIVFHSKNREKDQLHILTQLRLAAEKKHIYFPPVFAMAVYDSDQYLGVTSDNPRIVKDRAHQILITGYGIDKEGKRCVRQALAKALDISAEERAHQYVLDDGASVIQAAQAEGYQAYLIGDKGVTLVEAVQMIRDDIIASHQQRYGHSM